MSRKVLVTKEFHQRAIRAIEFKNLHGDKEIEDLLRKSWISFINHKADEKLIEEFTNYCEEYADQLGFSDILTRNENE